MYKQIEKSKENENRVVVNSFVQKRNFGLVDNRKNFSMQNLINQSSIVTSVQQMFPVQRIGNDVIQCVGKLNTTDLKSDVNEIESQMKNPSKTPKNNWIYEMLLKLCNDFEVDSGTTKQMTENLIKDSVINNDDLTNINTIINKRIEWLTNYHDPRSKRNDLDDRHGIRAPNTVDNLRKWLDSLITGRVADLYKGVPGYRNHAQAIQGEINRMLAEETRGTLSKEDVDQAVDKIVKNLGGIRPKPFGPSSFEFNFGPMRKRYIDKDL
ncbi:hypothetical protein [Pseudoalteromonas aliena]|uniref:hypothetical protein n=1 Tax=Pseudoalteromonas aliena TaxID=247523 RepID=UPI002494AB87|nr:hypothetical protein [Pseudoalteromonas aliena]